MSESFYPLRGDGSALEKQGGVPLFPQPSLPNLPSASYFTGPIKLGNEPWRPSGRLSHREGMARDRQPGLWGSRQGFWKGGGVRLNHQMVEQEMDWDGFH